MKHIIFYVNSMCPAGGIERVVATLANELCKDNKVTLLVKDKCESFYYIDSAITINTIGTYRKLDMNSRFNRIQSLLSSFILSVNSLKMYLTKTEFDYIYVTNPLSFWEAYFTFKCRNKIIASEHGSRLNYNFIYRLLKVGYKLSHCYSIPTRLDFEYYYTNGYPAAYVPHLRPKLDYKITDISQKNVINIGRFTSDKRQLLLLEIWSNILKKNSSLRDWTLILVGTGELEQEINNKINGLNILDRVKVIPPQEDVRNLYTSASIFALTSSSEGFGMVLLEALSFGLPVISFDCPSGPRDIIENNVDGILVSDDNVIEYESSLSKLMSNYTLREKMSHLGFHKAKNWNSHQVGNKWKEIL
ncbi:glycosyltransferase family 4 protein [Vibrio fluvialis]|uniref:glycosyltransferase family 4 protein n=1 Tax=Vibrio sp. bablab_jr001 TaxID=2755067 RepID=UPI0018F1C513|nr:glycosyltransferase family 4 protein [Vibrio sp. bablab_jr001]MBY7825779.1 glycosyltransferase family 4 protein [Vibrio fluvialis]MBY8254305.1 glycosyltransferase family 4 protein [Vibrio fluvialis]